MSSGGHAWWEDAVGSSASAVPGGAGGGSFLRLYRAALRLRRDHPALGRGELSWRGEPEAAGLLCFDREPGFTFAANLGPVPLPVPPHRELLLASGPVPDGSLAPDTAVRRPA